MMTEKLIGLLASAKQINSIPKADIPGLLGEIEVIKARLLARLMEFEEQQKIAFHKTATPALKAENSPNSTQHEPPIGPQGRLLRLKEVVRIVGLSRSTVYAYERDGKFPKHRNLGPRSVAWLDTEIHEWIRKRL
jgi:prophage regulatory protein